MDTQTTGPRPQIAVALSGQAGAFYVVQNIVDSHAWQLWLIKHKWYSYNSGYQLLNKVVYFLSCFFFLFAPKTFGEETSIKNTKYKLHEGHILYGLNNRDG